jgi:hypothetical protein
MSYQRCGFPLFLQKNILSKQLKNKDLGHCIGGLVITFASCQMLYDHFLPSNPLVDDN